MNRILLAFAAALALFTGCEQDPGPVAPQLVKITRDHFDHKGGLASADFNTAEIAAESSENWCRVAVFEKTVNINVLSYTGDEERTAVVTVTGRDGRTTSFNIIQDRFKGIAVTPETLVFSDDQRSLNVSVISSGTYTVELTENPNDAFSYVKNNASITFSTKNAADRTEKRGRAVVTPEEGDPVIITLIQPEKSIYDYLIGEWNITKTSGSHPGKLIFSRKSNNASYNVTLPTLPSYPFVAELVNGKVVIQSGQQMGNNSDTYYSLHYNGPMDGQGVYIFKTPNRVAWAAEPVFNEENRTISLSFSDNGQGMNCVAQTFAIWGCSGNYFNFNQGSGFFVTDKLELSKNY